MRPTINENAEPEKKEQVLVSLDDAVQKSLEIYDELPTSSQQNDIFSQFYELPLPILNPVQIDLVLQHILQEHPRERVNKCHTALYFTTILRKSYVAGNNNFVLHTKDSMIKHLGGMMLSGDGIDKLLQLTIYGGVGERCGSTSCFLDLQIHGNIGGIPFENMSYSHITIHGAIGDPTNFNYRAFKSTFKTTNENTYEKLKKMLAPADKNHVLFYDAQGNILERYPCDQQ